MTPTRLLTPLIALLCCMTHFAVAAGETPDEVKRQTVSLIPTVHATVRARFEASTVESRYRFQVRNARVSIGGKIIPQIEYFVNTDFCDRGKIKFLDAWARAYITGGLDLRGGQFRMPFGVDIHRGPDNYYFSNRSFIGRQMANFRAVGAELRYNFKTAPVTLQAGAFNPSTIGDHTPWNSALSYSAKATWRVGAVTLAAGFMSIEPDSVRANLIDGAVAWHSGRWHIEGEYVRKHYTGDAHRPCHGWNIFGDYAMPVRAGYFNQLSAQARFDGMTAHSDCRRDDSRLLVTNDPRRTRITAGLTLSCLRPAGRHFDIRANYEKYFYADDVTVTPDMGDKLVIEMILRF